MGEVLFPRNLIIPMPRVLPELSRLSHGVRSGNVTIVNSKTIEIQNFEYDGTDGDAHFSVGTGDKPHANGMQIANELERYIDIR